MSLRLNEGYQQWIRPVPNSTHLHVLKADAGPRLLLRLWEQLLRVGKVLAHTALLLLLLRLLWLLMLRLVMLWRRLNLAHGQGSGIPALHAWHLEGVSAIDSGHRTFRMDNAPRQPWQLLHAYNPFLLVSASPQKR